MRQAIVIGIAALTLNCSGTQVPVDWPDEGCDLRYDRDDMTFTCGREEYDLSGNPYRTEGGGPTLLRGYRPLQKFYYINGRMHVIEENPDGGLNILLRTQHGPVSIRIGEEGEIESARVHGL